MVLTKEEVCRNLLKICSSLLGGVSNVHAFLDSSDALSQDSSGEGVNDLESIGRELLSQSSDVVTQWIESGSIRLTRENVTRALGQCHEMSTVLSEALLKMPPTSTEQRLRDGLDVETPYSPYRPLEPYFSGTPPPLIPLLDALASTGIMESSQLDSLPMRSKEFFFCSFCRRVTSDDKSTHHQCKVGHPPYDAAVDPPYTLEHILSRAKLLVAENNLKGCGLYLAAYTQETPLYSRMNTALRGMRDPFMRTMFSNHFGSYFVGLMHDLQRLGKKRYAGTVFRGIDKLVTDSIYSPGNVLSWPGPTSTTTSLLVAKKFLRSPGAHPNEAASGTLFVIESKSGIDVSSYSDVREESEVLFPPGTLLKVESIVGAGGGLRAVLQRSFDVELTDVKIVVLKELTLHCVDDLVPSFSPLDAIRYGPAIQQCISSMRQSVKTISNVRQMRPPPLSDPIALAEIIPSAVPDATPEILKIILCRAPPRAFDVSLIHSWICAYMETQQLSAVFLFDWACDYLCSSDLLSEQFKDRLAACLIDHSAGVIPEKRVFQLIVNLSPAGLNSYVGDFLYHSAAKGFLFMSEGFLNLKADVNHVVEDYEPMTALMIAAAEGHLDVCRLLISRGALVQPLCGGVRRCSLKYAAQGKNIDIMRLLLEHMEDDVSMVYHPDDDPFLHAVAAGSLELCKLLYTELQIDLNAGPHRPIWFAVRTGQYLVCRFLIEAGADVNFTQEKDGLTPLICALIYGFEDIALLLLEHDADILVQIPDTTLTPMHLAARHGMLDLLYYVCRERWPAAQQPLIHDWLMTAMTTEDRTCLHEAVANGHEKVSLFLIDQGADVEIACTGPGNIISSAVKTRSFELLQRLSVMLPSFATRNESRTAFFEAIRLKEPSLCRIFIRSDILSHLSEQELQQCLLEGCQRGLLSLCTYLLDNGAIADVSIFVTAAQYGHVDVCSLLLELDPQLLHQTHKGRSALHAAAHNGYLSIVDMLLNRHCNINAVTSDGVQAIHFACKEGHVEIVRLLLRNGADVNVAVAGCGLTPLMTAVVHGHAHVCQCLLDHKANVLLKRPDGHTALTYALFKNFSAISAMLLSHIQNNKTIYPQFKVTLEMLMLDSF